MGYEISVVYTFQAFIPHWFELVPSFNFGQRLRGGQNVSREFFLGGGKRTAECALQNHFWRPQKLGLVWSVPLSFKGNDSESPKKGGGKTYRRWGVQKRFWGGVFRRIYGMFSTPPEFSTPLGRSLTIVQDIQTKDAR